MQVVTRKDISTHNIRNRMVRIEVKERFMSACDPYHTRQNQLQSRQSGAYLALPTAVHVSACIHVPSIVVLLQYFPLVSSDQFTATNINYYSCYFTHNIYYHS